MDIISIHDKRYGKLNNVLFGRFYFIWSLSFYKHNYFSIFFICLTIQCDVTNCVNNCFCCFQTKSPFGQYKYICQTSIVVLVQFTKMPDNIEDAETKKDTAKNDHHKASISSIHFNPNEHLHSIASKVTETIEEIELKDLSANVSEKANKILDSVDPEKIVQLQNVNLVLFPIRTIWTVFRQMLIPFIISGLGQVIAGLILNTVSKWEVFRKIPHLLSMISPFLGMVTNIKSTLASRMTVQTNIGSLDSWTDLRHFLAGNLKVVQCQATVVSLFNALASIGVSALMSEEARNRITWKSTLLLCSSSVSTSMLANSLLGSAIGIVIIVARKYGLNTGKLKGL